VRLLRTSPAVADCLQVASGNRAKSDDSNLTGTAAREDVRPVRRTWYSQTSRAVQRPNPRSVTSHGPSGIGIVDFGDIGVLRVEAPIETTRLGACRFNVYDGGDGGRCCVVLAMRPPTVP